MSDESEQCSLLKTWLRAFKRASDFDSWGQPIEASDIYYGLSKQLFVYVNDKGCELFSKNQKRTLEKIELCLDARRSRLTKNESPQNACVDPHNLRQLEATLANLISGSWNEDDQCTFPIEFSSTDSHSQSQLQHVIDEDVAAEFPTFAGKCNLLPKPLPVSGKTFLTVSVNHIGVKDESQFIDPYISISVRDHTGQSLGSTQDTSTASVKLDKAVVFHCDVHIQKAIEDLPSGFAIFFEFKHFKPKKDSFSTKCWTLIEQDEINDGSIALELYKKPTDFKRRSLKLLTVKPLFLHLHLSLNH